MYSAEWTLLPLILRRMSPSSALPSRNPPVVVVRVNEEAALMGLKGARRSGCPLVAEFLLQSDVVAVVELEESVDLSAGILT